MKIVNYDIRGVYKKDLDEDLAFKLGQAALIYTFRKTHEDAYIKVVVGGDVRPSTAGLKRTLIEGISSIGGNVYDIGTIPTPVFHFANKYLNANLGVMVTASHNPPEYNGFKISMNGTSLGEEELNNIVNILLGGKFRRGKMKGKVEQFDIIQHYEDHLAKKISYHGNLKVVIDAGNGTQSELSPVIFRKYGHKVVELYCNADGNFPNRGPNPAIGENLADLAKKVRDENADLGVAFDGDGDRIAFINHKGIYIENDKIIAIFARHFLKQEPNSKIVYDIKSSKAVSDVIKQNSGFEIIEKAGHSFMRLRMIEQGAIFGGELSGHFFFKALGGEDDAIFAGLLLCKIIQETAKKLADLEAEVPAYFNTPDIRVPFDMKEADKLIQDVIERFKDHPIVTTDGLKILFPHGWALIRKSSTEPLLTFRFEADDRYAIKDIVTLFITRIPEVRDLIFDKITIA